jgi:hypothetical protein
MSTAKIAEARRQIACASFASKNRTFFGFEEADAALTPEIADTTRQARPNRSRPTTIRLETSKAPSGRFP